MKNQHAQSCPGYLAVIIIALVSAFITVIAITFIYHYRFAQEIKVVDLKGYIRNQAALLSAGEISKAQWQENLDVMEKRLQNEPANHVILLKEVVLKNAEEHYIK